MYGLRVKNLLIAISLWLVCSAVQAVNTWSYQDFSPTDALLYQNGGPTGIGLNNAVALTLGAGDSFQNVATNHTSYRVDGGGPVLLATGGSSTYTIASGTSVSNLVGPAFNFTGNASINVSINGSVIGFPAFTTDFNAGSIGAMNITMVGGTILGNILAAPAVSGVIDLDNSNSINGTVALGNNQTLQFTGTTSVSTVSSAINSYGGGTYRVIRNTSSFGVTAGSTITNVGTILVDRGFLTTGGNISGVNAQLGVSTGVGASQGTLNLNHTISGPGSITNLGTINNNVNNALAMTGTFTNAGTLNVVNSLTMSNTTTSTGLIAISNGRTFTNNGSITLNSGATMSGAGAFTNSGAFFFESTNTSTTGLGFTGLLTNSGTMHVNQNLTRANSTTNSGTILINSGFTFTNTGSLTFSGSTASMGGTGGIFTNQGTFDFNSTSPDALTFTGLFTNSSALNVNQNLTRANSTSNTGTIAIANGITFTNSGSLTNTGSITLGNTSSIFSNTGTVFYNTGATITGPGSVTNSGRFDFASSTTGLGFTGLFTNSGALNVFQNLNRANSTSNTGTIAIANGITFTNSGTLTSTGAITLSGATSTFSNTGTVAHNTGATISGPGSVTNAGTFNFNSTDPNSLSFTGLLTSSSFLNVNQNLTRANSTSNTGTIAIANGVTFTNSGTLTSTGAITLSGATSTFSNSGTATYLDNATMSGPGAFTNSGSFFFESTNTSTTGLGFTGLFTNSGTMHVNQNLTRANSTNNSGTILMNSGKTFTNTGSLTFSGNTASMGGTGGIFTNQGTFNFNSATPDALTFTGLFTNSGALNVQQNLNRPNSTSNTGTIAISPNVSFTILGPFSGAGTITGGSGSTLNVGNTSTTVILSGIGAITNVANINISGTGTTFTTASNITGVSSKFTVASGATATLTAQLTGTGSAIIDNFGSLTFGAGSSVSGFSGNGTLATTYRAASNNIYPFTNEAGAVTTFTQSAISNIPYIANFGTITFTAGGVGPTTVASSMPTFNEYANSIINFNDDITLSGTNIVYTTFTGIANQPQNTTALTIGNNKTLALTNGSSITGIKSTTINAGSTLSLASGSTVSTSGSSSLLINGTLAILTGGSFTINSGSNVTGNGNINNNGNFNIDSTNFTLGGNFNNQSGGVLNITGTPTITFGGNFTNDGLILSTFNASNSLPKINIGSPGNMANGTIGIGYTGNFIAAGDYPFIIPSPLPANAFTSLAQVGAASLPTPDLYIRSWSLNIDGGTLNVAVDRIGFGNVATDPNAKLIGYFMEQIGANNPTAAQLSVLNALEHITSVSELNLALLELMPPEYVPLQTLSLLQSSNLLVQGRIMQARYFSSGDSTLDHGVWIRPTGGAARQSAKDNLPGYNSSFNGVIGGMDTNISPKYKMGAALSVYHSTVNDTINTSSVTRINSYQAMVYGTVKGESSEFLDWIINGGINQYHGIRGILVGDVLNSLAVAHYTGQQFSAKVIASKQFKVGKYYQLTPLATAQYGFLRQLSYTEEGAGPWNLVVQPNNINLFQVGIGAQFAVPFDQGKTTSIPEIHTQLLVDAKGGAVQSTSQFIDGGPLMNSLVQPGRLILQLGASLTFAISEDIQLIANYDFEVRHRYKSHEVYLNLRYMF